LADHGLKIVERRAQNFLPAADGDSYLLTGEGRTGASVAKLSAADAAAIGEFSRELEDIADVLRQFVLRAPPNLVEGFGAIAIREHSTPSEPPPSCAVFRWNNGATCSISSPARPARCWISVSRMIWSR